MTPLLWSLIAIQIAMGAFDTLYHHELTERLAWRTSQRHELQLHSIRNAFYLVLFVVLGWVEAHGIWALMTIAVLAAEIVITLMDFVEEDLSRKLAASERINHTLLAINYGAILALLLPVLFDWARQPSAVLFADHGLISIAATLAAFGVGLFALRDFAASERLVRLRAEPAKRLMERLAVRQTVLVTGATGFVGSRLAAALAGAGHQVIALVRNPSKAEMLAPPVTLITNLDQLPDDSRIETIVNLAGEPISNGPWTQARRDKIVQSRLDMTGDVVRLIARLKTKPAVLVSGSAIGWYGLWQDQVLSESATSVRRDKAALSSGVQVPTRQPLQPEATGAAMEVTKWLKPSDSGSRYTVTARVCRP